MNTALALPIPKEIIMSVGENYSYGPFHFSPYAEVNDPFVEQFANFYARLHIDRNTGHMQFHPMPSDTLLGQYYNGTFSRSDQPPTPEKEFTPQIVEVAKGVRRHLQKLANFPDNFSVHDIGCGFGAFVWAWQQIGCRATGNELNKEWMDIANPHCNNDLYAATLDEALKQIQHPIDFFFSAHVLEHLPDPIQMLKTAAARMHDASLFYICLPNNHCYRTLKEGRRTGHDYLRGDGFPNFPMHVNFFTPKSLCLALRHVGLEPIDINTRAWDEVPEKAADPTWAQEVRTNLLGGELYVLACKPGNTTVNRQGNLDELVEKAFQHYENTRWANTLSKMEANPPRASL